MPPKHEVLEKQKDGWFACLIINSPRNRMHVKPRASLTILCWQIYEEAAKHAGYSSWIQVACLVGCSWQQLWPSFILPTTRVRKLIFGKKYQYHLMPKLSEHYKFWILLRSLNTKDFCWMKTLKVESQKVYSIVLSHPMWWWSICICGSFSSLHR